MEKILEINFKSRFGFGPNTDLRLDESIPGTNGATVGKLDRVKKTFSNFHKRGSSPYLFRRWTCDFDYWRRASNGQWGPIVGTELAIVGSLYLLLAADMEEVGDGNRSAVEECQ
ncbi:hypothetical protein J3459_006770 [Metarhizium acridum]|nr:hypothetical protein J3459_006770 [Metarhizium acridum]